MEGILNAIKSIFRLKKKDEEELPPPPAPMSIPKIQSIPQQPLPISTPTQPPAPLSSLPKPQPLPMPEIKTEPLSASLKKTPPPSSFSTPVTPLQKEYWEPAPNVRVRDIIRELPSATEKTIHPIVQGVLRNIVSAAKTMGSSYEPYTPKGEVAKYLFGEEPIYSVGQTASQRIEKAKKGEYLGMKIPEPIAVPLIGGLTIADVALDAPGVNLPIGEGKKEARLLIENADELVSVASKEFKKKAGESVMTSLGDLIRKLSKSGYEISDDLLDELDKKALVGDNFSVQKVGKNVEFIFDEGFRPIKKIVGKLPEIVKQGTKKIIPKAGNEDELSKVVGIDTNDELINFLSGEQKQLGKKGIALKTGTKTGTGVFVGNRELTKEEVKALEQEEQALREATKTFDPIAERFGKYADDARAMIAKIKRFGESVNKKTNELYREHIPATSKHMSSDELATNLGMTERELMDELNRFAESGETFKKVNQSLKKTTEEVASSRSISEKEFNEIYRDANRFLKEKYDLLTPKQYSRVQEQQVKISMKGQSKLLKEAEKAFREETINVEGKGGIRVPFGEIDITKWKDKDILLLNRETPIRNIEDITGKDAPVIKDFFVNRVAEATRQFENFVKNIKVGIEENIIKKLGITPNSNEDKLVMRWGEGRMTLEELKKAAPDKWQQIIEADKYFRNLYDDLLNKINDTITKYGYEPVKKRKDYYTHYQEIGNLFQQLGAITRSERLPAWLNGLTADFKPGKQFFQFAQPRLGGDYTESAIGAFENYLRPAARQIYYTDVIQRGRALHKTLAEAIQKNESLSPTHLSNFMAWLNDYVNILAGKKSLMARATEGLGGRKMYGVVNTLAKQASANLIAGNISAAFTNWIPLTQALATTDKASFVKGLITATLNPIDEAEDFMIDGVQSSFLRRRFPYKDISQTLWEKFSEKAAWLFYTIDKWTSTAVVSSKYFEGLKKGFSPEEAMKIADDYAARLIGDRSFGQMPLLFENQGLLKLATMFQLEVNNQLSFIFKDIPKQNEKDFIKTASTIGQIVLYSHLFNNVFQWATGRRPAFDPIYIALHSYDILQSSDSPNEKVKKIGETIADNLPFISILTGGGRIPVAAGIPSARELSESIPKSLLKFGLTYFPPAGGYQAYKTIEGMENYIKGYSETAKGSVRYPVEKNISNLIRSVLFGQYSTPAANKYYESGETALGEQQSAIFKTLMETNPQAAIEYYNRVHLLRDVQDKIQILKDYAKELTPMYLDPATRDQAVEKFNQKASEVGEDIAKILEQKEETKGIVNDVLNEIGNLFKQVVGKEVEAAENTLQPADKQTKTEQTETKKPYVGQYEGLYNLLHGNKPGEFKGISDVVSQAVASAGVKPKKISTKKYTFKGVGLPVKRIKTSTLQEYKPYQIKPLGRVKISGGGSKPPSKVRTKKLKVSKTSRRGLRLRVA
jgi:hypothetical protein